MRKQEVIAEGRYDANHFLRHYGVKTRDDIRAESLARKSSQPRCSSSRCM
jgi:hypothetical protein